MSGRNRRSPDELLSAFRPIIIEHPTIGINDYERLTGYADKPGRKKLIRIFGSWENVKSLALGKVAPVVNTVGNSEERLSEEYTGDTGNLLSISTRIASLEELLDVAKVDRSVWEVESYTVNSWEVGAKGPDGKIRVTPLHQVKAKLRRIVLTSLDVQLRSILEEIREAAPVYPSLPAPSHADDDESYMYEICIFDLHIAKLAWAQETGEDYDTKIAEERYLSAIANLMQRTTGLNLERIDLPTGNDFFHVDNLQNLTTAGTRQDVDSRWQRAFERSIKLLVKTLLSLAEVAPVNMLMIPGNHDFERVYYLGEALKQRFWNSDRITIDNSPNPRKYTRYGTNLIGYTHGKDERADSLPLIMASEQPQLWAETKFREWHCGHVHRAKEVKYLAGDTYNGVSVRTIPSLSGTDSWHHLHGYVGGRRAAEAYLWGKETGYAGHFSANVLT